MEIFDVYDKNGNLTGLTREKGYKCREGEYYLGVHVYIYNSKGEFLMQRRALTKKFKPGGWETLLEHAVTGETGLDTAIRGVREELGLRFNKENFTLANRYIWHEINHIADIFFLKAHISLSDVTLQTEELTEVKWISTEEMVKFTLAVDYRPFDYLQIVLSFIHNSLKR